MAPSTRRVCALGVRRAALHNMPAAPKGTVLPAARSAAGRTDAVRKHGGRRAWGARETRARRRSRDTTGHRAPDGRRQRAPGATHALLPARWRALAVLPSAPPRGREDGRERRRRRVVSARSGRDAPRSTTRARRPERPPSSWPRASAAGRTDAVRKHGGRRAWGARETCARRRSRDTRDDRAPGGRRRRAPGATHALLPAR